MGGPSVAGMWGGYGNGGRVAFAGWSWCRGLIERTYPIEVGFNLNAYLDPNLSTC